MNKYRKIILFSLCILVFALLLTFYHQIKGQKVIAMVNDNQIRVNDVAGIYKQFDKDDIEASIVLSDIIDEYIAIENASSYDISVTDDMVQENIDEMREETPDLYKTGVKLYGKDGFYDGVKKSMIYDQVHEIVIREELSKNRDTYMDAFFFKMASNSSSIRLMSKEDFFEEYSEEFREYVFNAWLQKKKENVSIKILDGWEKLL